MPPLHTPINRGKAENLRKGRECPSLSRMQRISLMAWLGPYTMRPCYATCLYQGDLDLRRQSQFVSDALQAREVKPSRRVGCKSVAFMRVCSKLCASARALLVKVDRNISCSPGEADEFFVVSKGRSPPQETIHQMKIVCTDSLLGLFLLASCPVLHREREREGGTSHKQFRKVVGAKSSLSSCLSRDRRQDLCDRERHCLKIYFAIRSQGIPSDFSHYIQNASGSNKLRNEVMFDYIKNVVGFYFVIWGPLHNVASLRSLVPWCVARFPLPTCSMRELEPPHQ